jgi:PncC family amidohydrolase
VVSYEERLGELLAGKGLRVAVAESCTGGLIASRVTDVAGSSRYFDVGFVTYSNRAKEVLLSVPPEMLEAHGAVSHEVAERMAHGVRNATGADIGLAVTGIAGPGGGTAEKPVGTVYLGLSDGKGLFARKYRFHGNRQEIKRQTADAALRFAVEYLEGRVP